MITWSLVTNLTDCRYLFLARCCKYASPLSELYRWCVSTRSLKREVPSSPRPWQVQLSSGSTIVTRTHRPPYMARLLITLKLCALENLINIRCILTGGNTASKDLSRLKVVPPNVWCFLFFSEWHCWQGRRITKWRCCGCSLICSHRFLSYGTTFQRSDHNTLKHSCCGIWNHIFYLWIIILRKPNKKETITQILVDFNCSVRTRYKHPALKSTHLNANV